MFDFCAACKKHNEYHADNAHRYGHVGFEHDKHARRATQKQHEKHVCKLAHIPLACVCRNCHNHKKLGVFAGLYGKKSEIQPPFRAVTFNAYDGQKHRAQKRKSHKIQKRRKLFERLRFYV